jgi:uncharacterized protein with GYD domain
MIFVMFGNYTTGGVNDISSERTEKARALIKQHGGTVKAMYALLGQYDLVLITEFRQMADAMKVAIALERLTGISFSTAAALPIEEFDQMIAEI